MSASYVPYTLLYVPRAVDQTALGIAPFLDVEPFGDYDVNPLAWRMDEKGGTLLDVRVKKGHLSKRRRRSGTVAIEDPEQRGALFDIICQLVSMTPNRWVMFAHWTGWDAEVKEVRRVGEPTDEKLAAAEDDVWYRFEGPPLYG